MVSYVVTKQPSIKDAFQNFAFGSKVGPYQLFYFPTSTADIVRAKSTLMSAFTTRPSLQFIEIDGSAMANETQSIADAAKQIINPNLGQGTTTFNASQLENYPLYCIIVNNYNPVQETPNQSPIDAKELESLFPKVKVLIIYLYKFFDTNTEKTANFNRLKEKMIKTLDEDNSTYWSVISNQFQLINQPATDANIDAASKANGGNLAALKLSVANAASVSPDFVAKVNAIDGSTSVSDAQALIASYATYPAPSTQSTALINTFTQARDVNVFLLDGSDDMNFIQQVQSLPTNKPYILLVHNYQLDSTLCNRELVKMKSMALSVRANASGAGYNICEFMIATPAPDLTAPAIFLAYQSR